jgi:hypothetical protein
MSPQVGDIFAWEADPTHPLFIEAREEAQADYEHEHGVMLGPRTYTASGVKAEIVKDMNVTVEIGDELVFLRPKPKMLNLGMNVGFTDPLANDIAATIKNHERLHGVKLSEPVITEEPSTDGTMMHVVRCMVIA